MKKRTRLVSAILIFILLFTIPIFCYDFSQKALSFGDAEKQNVEIYELWHIETFEGGSIARINFFKNTAIEFEKENKGKLFLVKTIEPENLESELENGLPDIISFGHGVGRNLLPHLTAFDNEYDARQELLESGIFNGKLFALPVILSGYAFISNGETNPVELLETNELYVGNSGYTDATPIYKTLCNSINKNETLSAYQTYLKFTQGEAKVMLGSARDVFRSQNLMDKGRMTCSYEFVSGYSDLIQYIGITNDDKIVKDYIAKLMSEISQRKLSNYSLFSALNIDIYSQSIFNEMEEELRKELFVPNVFKGK